MDKTSFEKVVQEHAETGTVQDTKKVISATLQTLGERLPKAAGKLMAAKLPEAVSEQLKLKGGQAAFELEEFFQRIKNRSGLSMQNAVKQARAVCEAIAEALAPQDLQKIIKQLPEGYQQLFYAGPRPGESLSEPAHT